MRRDEAREGVVHRLMPIETRPRAIQVRDKLVAMIRDGLFKHGDKLPTESQLSEMFGVGRSSVRDAMQSLVGLGIVEIRPGRGTFVSRLSLNDLLRMVDGAVRLELGAALQLHEVRAMIEVTAARLAAVRHTDEDLTRLTAASNQYRDLDETSPPELLTETDLRFHRAIVEATHNDMLLQLYSSISGLLREHRRQYASASEQRLRSTVQAQHDAILQAIAASDLHLATTRMQAHMRDVWTQIEQTAIREGDPSPGDQTYLPLYDDVSSGADD